MIRTVVDQIYDDLKERVLGGSWALGVRIFEDEIATDLSVSRSAVREAVRLLEQEGLLIREPHRGLYVASPSGRDAFEVAQVRAILEAHAVRWGDPPSRETLHDLEVICQELDDLEAEEHRADAVNADRRFHARVVSGCHNAMLVKKFRELDGHVAIFFHWVSAHVPGRLHGVGDRHRLLLEVLAKNDPDAFQEAILEHYLDAATDLARHLPQRLHEVHSSS